MCYSVKNIIWFDVLFINCWAYKFFKAQFFWVKEVSLPNNGQQRIQSCGLVSLMPKYDVLGYTDTLKPTASIVNTFDYVSFFIYLSFPNLETIEYISFFLLIKTINSTIKCKLTFLIMKNESKHSIFFYSGLTKYRCF